ncbi:MAG: hypothetical protein FJ108_08800 [Deltaproteobacteria bacterium]|nr:hypothetical protein [Deltaproteobacteria bacterium]
MARRNLGDVLHYFISEEEQREAREAARARATPPLAQPSRAPRYCLPADPERPLSCALALELAGGMGAAGRPARVISSFPASPLVPRVRCASWEVCADPAVALAAISDDVPAIAVERPARIGAMLGRIAADGIDGVLLPVELAAWGLGRALGLLRELAPALAGRRVLALVVGSDSPVAAADLIARLSSAARRQYGVGIELLGELARDEQSYRSLLRGESLHALEDESATGRSLRALCQRLSQRLAA